MNDTMMILEVGKIRVIMAQRYKTKAHTTHRRCSVSGNCYQFMNGYIIFSYIFFKLIVNIIAFSPLSAKE